MKEILNKLKHSLIVSCQAPVDSPLHDPIIIATIASACVKGGSVGVRIDTPSHIQAVREKMPDIPIIGLWKRQYEGYEVYITPRFAHAVAVSQAGADIIAIDATNRQRPEGEKLATIITKIHQELGKLVMADVDTYENAIAAQEYGADLVGTTLYGYTPQTKHLPPPGYSLLEELQGKLDIPLICEGGITNLEEAGKSLQLGAFAVVVGTAITGIDYKVREFQKFLLQQGSFS